MYIRLYVFDSSDTQAYLQGKEVKMPYKVIHGLSDTAVAPSLMMSHVSHTRGNMYKVICINYKHVFKCDIKKYLL